MASPIVGVMTQIATDWEALTPPDWTAITYEEATELEVLDGVVGDRRFSLRAVRGNVIGQRGTALSQVEWSVFGSLRLSATGRGLDDLADAVANESNLLLRAIEKRTTWPAGALSVETLPVTEDPQDDGDVLVAFEFACLVEETD
jgi:hypothetical protein